MYPMRYGTLRWLLKAIKTCCAGLGPDPGEIVAPRPNSGGVGGIPGKIAGRSGWPYCAICGGPMGPSYQYTGDGTYLHADCYTALLNTRRREYGVQVDNEDERG